MEEALVLVLDYEGVCRLCLQGRGAFSDIFAVDDETPLAEQIRTLTSVEMSDTDNLPRKICHKCRYIVELCYELRSTVIKSNRLLCNSVEADDLIGEVAEAFRKTDNEDIFNDDNFEEIIQEQMIKVEEIGMLEDVRPSKKFKRKAEGMDYFSDRSTIESMENTIELHTESNESHMDCKMEIMDNCDFKRGIDGGKDYTSSKEVTLDEIKLDDSGTSQVHVLPEMSDDGSSENLMARLKESANNAERPLRQQTCQLCLEVLPDRPTLLAHVADHYCNSSLVPYTSATKPFACQECNLNFTIKMDLIIHHRDHLDINPYMCKMPGCNFDMRTREALRHHMYTHAKKKYVCNICGARYRRKVEIVRHKVRHIDEGHLFRCGLCWVTCKNRLSLKAHLKNHENGRRFKCDFPGCPKGFFSNSDLVIHSRSHSNDKCFKCSLCVCAYTSQSQLNRHLRRHEKPGPTKCDKCSEVFEDYGSFCNHRIATHGEWQPHRCKGCNQGYQSEQQLQKHLGRCKVALTMKALGTEDVTIIIEEKDSFSC